MAGKIGSMKLRFAFARIGDEVEQKRLVHCPKLIGLCDLANCFFIYRAVTRRCLFGQVLGMAAIQEPFIDKTMACEFEPGSFPRSIDQLNIH